jgi:MFS family permease
MLEVCAELGHLGHDERRPVTASVALIADRIQISVDTNRLFEFPSHLLQSGYIYGRRDGPSPTLHTHDPVGPVARAVMARFTAARNDNCDAKDGSYQIMPKVLVEHATQWPLVTATVVISFVGFAPAATIAALYPLMRESLHLGAGQVGAVLSGFFLTAASAALVVGQVSPRVRPKKLVVVGCITSGLGSLLIGLVASSWVSLICLACLCGVGNGFLQPITNLLLSKRVNARAHGRAAGMKQAAIPLGAVLAGSAGVGAGRLAGWPVVFIGFAAVALTLAFLSGVHPLFRDNDAVLLPVDRSSETQANVSRGVGWLVLVQLLGSVCTNALVGFAVMSLVRSGLGVAAAGAVLAGGSLECVALRVTVGWTVDRLSTHIGLMAVMLGTGTIGYLLLASGRTWLAVTGCVIALGPGWAWNGLMNYILVHDYHPIVAKASGRILAAASTGGIVGPLMFGILYGLAGGLEISWVTLSIISGVAAVIVPLASTKNTAPRQVLR